MAFWPFVVFLTIKMSIVAFHEVLSWVKWIGKLFSARTKPFKVANKPFRRRPPRTRIHKSSVGHRLPVDITIKLPRILLCLAVLQIDQKIRWIVVNQLPQPGKTKSFHFADIDCCIETSRIRGRTKKKSFFRQAQQLISLFTLNKNLLVDLAMNGTNVQGQDDKPRTSIFDSDADKFLIDSGASHHLWKQRKAFSSYRLLTREERKQEALLGVNGETVMPLGIGTVPLKLEDDLNDIHVIELRDVRHLPSAPLNIMVPQVFVRQRREEGDTRARCSIDDSCIELEWLSTKDQVVSKYVPLNKNNVGMCFTAPGFRHFRAFMALAMPANQISDSEDEDDPERPPPDPPPDDENKEPQPIHPIRSPPSEGVTTDFTTDPNVLPPIVEDEPLLRSDQDLLMQYHERLGHCSFQQLKQLAEKGVIPKRLAKVAPPKCPSCLYGKAHKKPWRTHKVDPKIRTSTVPGAVVSMDQLESPVPGLVPIGKGQPTKKRFKGATVFVDHASDLTYVHLMHGLTTEETLEAKHEFERFAQRHGVTVQHYHCDNGRFADKEFINDVKNALQTISFCGVGAHHQNGIAERRIRDLTESARTMILHAAHRWPKTITANLWPQAVKHATNIRNALPRNNKTKSPISIFSNSDVEPNTKHFHPFGCPVYVLQAPLQTGSPHPKWAERSRVGVLLCHSPHHAASVPLILSTQTGLVSPQFHCVYDDKFETVKNEQHDTSIWKQKALVHKGDENRSDHLISRPLPRRSRTQQQQRQQESNLPNFGNNIPQALLELPDLLTGTISQIPADDSAPLPDTEPEPQIAPVPPEETPQPYPVDIAPTGQTRTGRQVRPPSRLSLIAYHCCFMAQDVAKTLADYHPLALLQMMSTAAIKPDVMPLHIALQQEDCDKFIQAMVKELKQHAELKHWKIVHKAQVPPNAKPIPMVWSFMRKKDPAGAIIKWKARLCAGGHKQVFGDTYWSTFSPVVAWPTVRCIFILALILGWDMRSIDFIMAYTQAKVKTDIFMQLPKGTTLPGLDPNKHLLKLQQNLYGLKDGQVTWHEHIKDGLLKQGFKQSNVDPCLFTKGVVLLVLYIDDAAFFSPDPKAIDQEVALLQKSFDLTDDGPLLDYLGARFIRHEDGRVELQQQKSIDNCLNHLGLGLSQENVKMHDTPAEANKILHADSDGPTRKQDWNYRAVIGSLNYLQAMSRPDLSYAVHQCARFCNDPKLSHEVAVKRICRYLRATRDKGLFFRPNVREGFKCYVDADWAGNWNKNRPNDPAGALSRTGYVIMYAGCPLVWGSKMQSLVALSTTEAEIIALSTALREVIHLQNLLEELRDSGFPIPFSKAQVQCRTFEDNAACIEVATSEPKIRPRTKHLAVRLFHFRSHVENGRIAIEHVPSQDQLADIFTKPLPRDSFRRLRDRLLNWSPDPIPQHEGV